MPKTVTAEQIVLQALTLLQRGLPPGDMSDREVLTELWGLFDNPAAHEVIMKARRLQPSVAEDSVDGPTGL